MVAGVKQRRDGKVQRGHAARRADRADAALQRGKALRAPPWSGWKSLCKCGLRVRD